MINHLIYAHDRCVLSVRGSEVVPFLQGLITNDMALLEHSAVLYTALLSPQGRYVFDFFVIKGEDPHQYWIDCPTSRASDLIKMLSFYKLRADVVIKNVSDIYAVILALESTCDIKTLHQEALICNTDPRHPALGIRALVPTQSLEVLNPDRDTTAYEQLRIQLGAPGEGDLIPQKSLPLESNFDIFNALSFTKGCYLGQELTTRTKFRGETRKRFLPCRITTPLDPIQSLDITQGDAILGTVRSIVYPHALALIRLEACQFVEDNCIGTCQGHPIVIQKPDWLRH
ncbi:MAG: CAF17-like 4Fe-4S cluster assembly/insertion protein YgfZ [Candidatus Nucleicultricaceae bacterium]